MKKTIFTLQDKSIWVFGGAGYLGQATVLLLQEMGAKVLCIDLGNRAKQFVESLSTPHQVIPETLDVSDVVHVKQFVVRQIQIGGIPDGMVNLTFSSTAKTLEELSEEDFDKVNHNGITASFVLAREVGTAMAQAGHGSIVLFSSMYGQVSPYPEVYEAPMNKNPVEYGMGKAAIIQIARYLAVHWGKQNVRCNCISPGPFPYPKVQQSYPDFVARLAEKSPMGRIGQPGEIAGAVAFLLSDATSYITGHNLAVDGGWTCW